MIKTMRQSTLQTLGLGTVLEIFENGKLPMNPDNLVDEIFGKSNNRGCLVVSGANGIVGAGKCMQLGSRLQPYDLPIIALDFPGVANGISKQYPGLAKAFGNKNAQNIMSNIIHFNYDGNELPSQLKNFNPRFLLEAIPEVLDIKKSHYNIFRSSFPEIEIRSVTSGFPSSQLGVSIAHPAFPHEINKIWEIVEPTPSLITQLFWSLGMVPIPVSDNWSFVLDVLFCGITLAALKYHQFSNMPFWKIDKYIRKFFGPNPFRAHDVIGAKGANFLTWSCLHHLDLNYGPLFKPTSLLDERKESGQNWYPQDHFRPLVNWTLNNEEEDEFKTCIFGQFFQMASLMLHEKRAHLSHLNLIGELCAQFRRGIIAEIRSCGTDNVIKTVESYHKLYPGNANETWYPNVFEELDNAEWQQLYVNAEHNRSVGIITINRESYSHDVNIELNRALDWLKNDGIQRIIVTGDFHLSTQMVGADTSNFFPALNKEIEGLTISKEWSQTARRLYEEFQISVGFINGKRCLGGMLELLIHCHYLISTKNADIGMPEVTLPVVPGMEGCHWPFRKALPKHWLKIIHLLLEGQSIKAEETVGWIVDYAGTMEDAIRMAWKIVTRGDHSLAERKIEESALVDIPREISGLTDPLDDAMKAGREAIFKNIQDSCSSNLTDALLIQAKHSAAFMITPPCQKGRVGSEYTKTMLL